MITKIGNLKLGGRLLLAPMLEPNDIAFRLLCKHAGATLTYTGMTNSLSQKEIDFDDKPAIQIFSPTTKGIKEFIKKYDSKVSLWGFNLGCPSKLSKKLSHGSFMHKDFDNLEKIFKIMRESTSKPISIKLRKSPQAIKIAKIAEKYIDAIGIHARTSSEGYSGKSDYNFALKLRDSIKIPVIYSGDVTKENIKKILEDFPFIFVGRASIGNPDIFSEFSNKKSNTTFLDYIKLAKKYNLKFRQIKYQAMNFTKGNPKAKDIRRKIILAKSVEELKKAYENK